MSVSITDLASLIWMDELNETNLTTIPEIAYWLRNNGIGRLNNLIFSGFSVDPVTQELINGSLTATSFGVEEAVILVQLYLVKFYQWQATNFLGAVGVNDVIEYTENSMTITKLNRTEQSKAWMNLANIVKQDLKDLVAGYKISKSTAKSIEGEEMNLLSTMLPRYNRVLNQGV